MKRALFLSLGLALFAGTAMAQNVSVDFDDGTLGGLVQTSVVTGTGVPGSAAGRTDVIFAGAADPGRAYIGTAGMDYASDDFQASVDVIINIGGGANAFFGIGPGLVGGDGTGAGPAFGEPSTGPAVYAAYNEDGRDGGQVNFSDSDSTQTSNITTTGGTTPVVGSGTHTLFMNYTFATGTVEFLADVDQLGTVISLGSFDASDNGFDATNAKIFIGGDDNTVFDNFQVTVPVAAIPEPASATLLGLGLVGIAIRRRRI